jgi:hypothetical protein
LGGSERSRTDTRLFTVFVSDDWALCRTGICTEDDAVLEYASDDGSAGACSFWEREALVEEESVPGERER